MAHRDRSILVADRRFRGITDMAGAAACRTRTRMTADLTRRNYVPDADATNLVIEE